MKTITKEMVEQRAKDLFIAGIRYPFDPEQCWSDGTHVNYMNRTMFKVDKYQYYVKAFLQLRDEAQYVEWMDSQSQAKQPDIVPYPGTHPNCCVNQEWARKGGNIACSCRYRTNQNGQQA